MVAQVSESDSTLTRTGPFNWLKRQYNQINLEIRMFDQLLQSSIIEVCNMVNNKITFLFITPILSPLKQNLAI